MTKRDSITRLLASLSERIEVDNDTPWSTDFILTAVTLTDVAIVIIHNSTELTLEHAVDILSFFNKCGFVFEQWRYGTNHWSHFRIKLQVYASVIFLYLFSISRHEQGKHTAIDSK